MTDTETIAALAAELERLGKMPEWIAISPSSGVHYKYNAVPKMDGSWQQGQTRLNNDSFALAALSGIAAEVCAEEGYYIVKSGKSFTECDEDGNEIWDLWCFEIVCHDWLCGNTPISQHDAYHAALIAALKQVEVKK